MTPEVLHIKFTNGCTNLYVENNVKKLTTTTKTSSLCYTEEM